MPNCRHFVNPDICKAHDHNIDWRYRPLHVFGRPFVKWFALRYRTVVLSCPVCLSVTLVYCGQTVGRIKMKLGMQVGLGSRHIVLDGDTAPLAKGAPPIFGPYLLRPNGCMDQDATWYGGRSRPRRLCVRRGPPKRGRSPQICGPCLLQLLWFRYTLNIRYWFVQVLVLVLWAFCC